MQSQMQVYGRKPDSLRKAIIEDLLNHKRRRLPLYVDTAKKRERSPGWSKIKGLKLHGALNVEWEAGQRMLTVRAIAKKGNTPHDLMGQFVAYLLKFHQRRVDFITIPM